MNPYSLYHLNKYKNTPMDEKQLQIIAKRQQFALLLKNKQTIEEIEELKDVIMNEIKEGLNPETEEDRGKRLKTAFQTLPYIIPVKKSVDMNVNVRKIEDIISQDIEEAKIIDEETEEK